MKGFLKRDLAMVAINARFYLILILIFGVSSVYAKNIGYMASLYAMIFAMSAVISLFNYDDANHWLSYGAAMPNGRWDMVTARYCVALLGTIVVGVVSLVISLLSRNADPGVTLLYMGVSLFYADLMIPLCYRFGGTKGRLLVVTSIGLVAGLIGAGGAVLGMSTGAIIGKNTGLALVPAAGVSIAVGGLGCLLSWRISQGIMAKKDL